MGWFTLCPEDGPIPQHAALHKQLISLYPDNASIMLAVHPSEFKSIDGTKGKLPISIYESATDLENLSNDTAMQVDGPESNSLRFRSVPFVIDTEESEMIAISYVAKGAGSAAAVGNSLPSVKKEKSTLKETDTEENADKGPILTTDEEDQLSGIQTRLNSVKMLQQRIQLLQRLVKSTPASYLSDQTVPFSDTSPSPEHATHLRNIQALLSKLSLLEPTGQAESIGFQKALQTQANDVAITSMLSLLGQEAQSLTEVGRKFGIVEQSKNSRNKGKPGFSSGPYMDNFTHPVAGLSDGGLFI